MSDIEDTADGLKARAVRTEEPYVAVPVQDLLEVLDRLAELEAEKKPAAEPDRVSNLKVGDLVETLIDVRYVPEGTRGIVQDIVPEEYSIKVRFAGLRASTGYNRYELGKVEK